MDLSSLTLKVILLVVPGLVCTIIYDRLIIRSSKRSEFHFVLLSLVFGLLSYTILQSIRWLNGNKQTLDTFTKITDDKIVPFDEIFYACIIAFILGFLITLIDTYRFIEKIANGLKISRSSGKQNLYTEYFFRHEGYWVYIRDIPNSLTYKGIIVGYNEIDDVRELALDNVTVLDYPNSNELYKIDSIYLSLPKDNIKIEIPQI